MHFLTSNADKFREVKQFLPDIEQLDISIEEKQTYDHEELVRDKARKAAEYATPVFVEDTALHIDCLNGLPGTFIKWFLERLGPEGIHDLVHKHDDDTATAVTKIALHDGTGVQVFTGKREGRVVAPSGDGFGWDPIFQPCGHERTYAGMDDKQETSHRTRALSKFTAWLDERH